MNEQQKVSVKDVLEDVVPSMIDQTEKIFGKYKGTEEGERIIKATLAVVNMVQMVRIAENLIEGGLPEIVTDGIMGALHKLVGLAGVDHDVVIELVGKLINVAKDAEGRITTEMRLAQGSKAEETADVLAKAAAQ